MPRNVDNRVVNMRFENKSFENNVGDTLKSLDKLKQNLNFDNQKRGLNELQGTANKFSLAGIGEATENIASKFTAMGAIAFTVLQNLTNRAVDAGIRIVKSLSLDSVMGGFQEYETNMNSIQTVLANTQSEGATLDNVNDALNQLNVYADQTIYNFSEMARNIGTFTAAGVKLDTSVKSIKGIANLAAISGSSSQQASTAMYQLSQAIASGSVKLMDWNSVVNAGMGGKVFQEALFETGKAMGTITDIPKTTTLDQWTESGKSFRDSLQDGWITAEVLTTTLEGMTGDLTDAQLKSKGYTDEQIKQIQKLGKMGQEAATKVKTLTQLIDTAKEGMGSGWTQTWQIIFGDFEEAKALFTGISDVLGDWISTSANARNEMLQQWKDMGGRQDIIDGLTNVFKALGQVLKPINEAFREFFPKKTGADLAYYSEKFKEFTERLKMGEDTIDKIKRTFRGFFAVFDTFKTVISIVLSAIKTFFSELDFGGGSILDITAKIGDFLVKMNDMVQNSEKFTDFMTKKFWPAVHKAAEIVSDFGKFIRGMFDGWDSKDAGNVTSFLENVKSKFEGLEQVWDRIGKFFKKVWEFIKPLVDQIKESFGDLWQAIKDSFSAGNFNSVLDLFNTGFLAMIALAIKKFLSGGFDFGGGILENISKSFEGLTGVLTSMQTSIKANTLLKIAGAVALLTASVIALSMIDSDKLQAAMLAMAAGFTELLVAMGVLVKISGSAGFVKVPMMATSLVILSVAMLGLAGAVKIMSTMDWQEIGKGLAGVAGVLGAIAAGMKLMPKGMMFQSASLIAIAGALNLLYLAVNNFSGLSWAEMGKGLTGVAGGLTAIAAGMAIMPKGMMLQSASLIAIAGALNLLYLAVNNLSGLSWAEMGKGLTGVAGGLTAIALGMKLMPKGIAIQSAALVVLSAALLGIGNAVSNMGGMSWEEIGKGLVAMAGSLGILAGALTLMSGTIAGSAAVTIAATGLLLMSKAVKSMGNLSWEEIGTGLVTMAGALAIIGTAGMLVTPAIPGLIALGVAAAGIGVGLGVAGLGMGAFLAGLSALATAGPAGISVILTAFKGLIEFIPELALKMGEGLINFLGVIAQNAPVLLEAFVALLDTFLEAIIKEMPKIVEAVGTLIQGILEILRDSVPDLIQTGLELLMALLQGISDNIGDITTTVIDIIAHFLQAIADNITKIVDAGVNIIVSLLKGIASRIGDIIAAGSDLVTSFISGLSKMVGDVISAGTKFITDLITGIGNAMADIVDAAVDVALAFLKAIADNTVKFVDQGFQIVIDLINGIAEAIRTRTSELMEAGWNLATALIDGVVDGIGKIGSKIWDALSGIVSNAWNSVLGFFGISSPSKKMRWVGEMMMEGWTQGIDRNGQKVVSSTLDAADDVMGGMKSAMMQISDVIDDAVDADPTITPILDLTKIEEGADKLNGLVSNVTPITAAASYEQASNISASDFAAKSPSDSTNNQTGNNAPSQVFEFKQYNTSPKTLSPAEVYRQTKNLISMAESKMDKPA